MVHLLRALTPTEMITYLSKAEVPQRTLVDVPTDRWAQVAERLWQGFCEQGVQSVMI